MIGPGQVEAGRDLLGQGQPAAVHGAEPREDRRRALELRGIRWFLVHKSGP